MSWFLSRDDYKVYNEEETLLITFWRFYYEKGLFMV
nr:MAG TPA: hypothetical protein [Caudoviricetes sp.]